MSACKKKLAHGLRARRPLDSKVFYFRTLRHLFSTNRDHASPENLSGCKHRASPAFVADCVTTQGGAETDQAQGIEEEACGG